MDENGRSNWYDDYAEDKDELQIDEYDITASPNDFNVMTCAASSRFRCMRRYLRFHASEHSPSTGPLKVF